ncbi:MAG: deoxyribonuclease IV, partial [Chlorobi bacterium]|nr:deoxyribonuclease IV [Chlorobiota bacterium]
MQVRKTENRIGVHCSVGGGLHKAFDEADSLGINTFQIFTRNQRQWFPSPLSDDDILEFHDRWKDSKHIFPIFSHASYLINLASNDEKIRKRSIGALIDEIKRASALGLSYVVVHPGAHKGAGVEKGIKNIISAIEHILRETDGSDVILLIENTAGQGSALASSLEELKQIVEPFDADRVGIALDTCHLFASGYDIRTEQGVLELVEKLKELELFDRLHVWHLNDSKHPLGSR